MGLGRGRWVGLLCVAHSTVVHGPLCVCVHVQGSVLCVCVRVQGVSAVCVCACAGGQCCGCVPSGEQEHTAAV